MRNTILECCSRMMEILPVVLVAFGAAVMVFNICKYFTMAGQMYHIHTAAKKVPQLILATYIALLVFFLVGYVVIGIGLLDPERKTSNLLVGFIFFFGSIFVLIGLVLQNSMCGTIRRSNMEITQALVASVEARDANLNGHSLHVAGLVKLIYRRLPKERQRSIYEEDLEFAALLHDIGKLGVPEHILNKPGALDAQEWDEMRRHPQTGSDILRRIDGFDEIAQWVLYHHERCDGKGYLGLPGEEIPFPSRLIAVADTYSAITMKRSYHGERTYAQAAQVLLECAGTQLDETLVHIFLSIPEQEVARCMPEENSMAQKTKAV